MHVSMFGLCRNIQNTFNFTHNHLQDFSDRCLSTLRRRNRRTTKIQLNFSLHLRHLSLHFPPKPQLPPSPVVDRTLQLTPAKSTANLPTESTSRTSLWLCGTSRPQLEMSSVSREVIWSMCRTLTPRPSGGLERHWIQMQQAKLAPMASSPPATLRLPLS